MFIVSTGLSGRPLAEKLVLANNWPRQDATLVPRSVVSWPNWHVVDVNDGHGKAHGPGRFSSEEFETLSFRTSQSQETVLLSDP